MHSKTLDKDFYKRESIIVAQDILGKYLVREINGQYLIGKIVETESYLPFVDPAAHSYIGKTLRNSVLFGEPGFSYVYSIHRFFCLNVVCDSVNVPGCVLIRALEPVKGVELMKEYRLKEENLTNGPGRLCQAFNINRSQNEIDLTNHSSDLKIIEGENILKNQIITTTRIGISKAKDLPLRFYLKENKFVSRLK